MGAGAVLALSLVKWGSQSYLLHCNGVEVVASMTRRSLVLRQDTTGYDPNDYCPQTPKDRRQVLNLR